MTSGFQPMWRPSCLPGGGVGGGRLLVLTFGAGGGYASGGSYGYSPYGMGGPYGGSPGGYSYGAAAYGRQAA